MNKKQLLELFKIEDIYELPKAVMELLEGDMAARDAVYLQLLELNEYDVSYDWFQGIYEKEMAQRKDMQQDFTPNSVGVVLAQLTGHEPAQVFEATAGNGSLLIADWWYRCVNSGWPLLHFPCDHPISAWELSNRAIPILLLNLSIRGVMGVIYHGDVLEQDVKMKYILLNRTNNTLGFSEIIKDEFDNKTIIEIEA